MPGAGVRTRTWVTLVAVFGITIAAAAWVAHAPRAQAASCGASSGAPRCELFTAVVNSSGRVVTSAAVGVEVHPRVSLVGTPTPTGTVRFAWYPNSTCQGLPIAQSADFAIVNGVVDATTFVQVPRKEGGYSVLARYSGDATHAGGAGDCQQLAVTKDPPRLLGSALALDLAEGGPVVVGKSRSVTSQLTITADSSVARVGVTHTYDAAFFAPSGALPAGCVVSPAASDAAPASIVCTVGRVQMGPGVTSFSRAFVLELEALKPTTGAGSELRASATFEFEGVGQATPFTVGPRSVQLSVAEVPRLRLPPETSATPGQLLLVPVQLEANGLGVPAEFRFEVTFDPTLLNLESVTTDGQSAVGDAQWSLVAPGRARVVVVSSGNQGATGGLSSLAVARFAVLGAGGRGALGLNAGEAVPQLGGATPIEVEGIGGTFIVIPVPSPPPPPPPPLPPAEESEPAGLPVLWDERLWTPEHVGSSLLFASLLGVTLTALAEIFNATVEENRSHFVGWWRIRRHWFLRLLRRGVADAVPVYRAAGGVIFGLGVAAYLLAASVLFAFLEPERMIETPIPAILAAGFAITVTTLASQIPRWIYVRRLSGGGVLLPPPRGQRIIELHADFWTLAFALVCVAVAWETSVRPGYAYGIVGVLAVNQSLRVKPDRETGQLRPFHLDWVSMLCLFVVTLAAWIAYSFAHEAHLDVPALLLERFWILGAETVALGLIPLSFLPGNSLWQWSRFRWAGLWLLGLFLYIQSVTAHAVSAGPVAIALTLAVYGAVTAGFWLYFKSAHDQASCPSCRIVNASSLDDDDPTQLSA